MHIRKPRLAVRCKMFSFLVVAIALVAATAIADDLEWKWDVSGHADPVLATGVNGTCNNNQGLRLCLSCSAVR